MVKFVVLGRGKEGRVRLEDSASEKERFFLFIVAGKSLDGVAHGLEVDSFGFFFVARPWPPVGVARPILSGPVELGGRHVLGVHLAETVPGFGIVEGAVSVVVVDFAEAFRPVAMLTEVLGQGRDLPSGLPPVRPVSVHPRLMGTLASEDGGTGGVAGGRGAVGPGKEHSALSQFTKVRGLEGTVLTEEGDAVVHVVDGDEEDVGLPGGVDGRRKKKNKQGKASHGEQKVIVTRSSLPCFPFFSACGRTG